MTEIRGTKMEIYDVKKIVRKEGEDTACLTLFDCITAEKKHVEIPEGILSERGIAEGKKVSFDKNGKLLKYIRVVAAVIRGEKDGTDKIFATERGYGAFKGWWEFPGGKIEPGETPEQALVREIREELTVEIRVGDLIHTIEYDYDTFHLSMDCFWAEIVSGELVLKEAEAAKWLSYEELESVKWLPADLELVDRIKAYWVLVK